MRVHARATDVYNFTRISMLYTHVKDTVYSFTRISIGLAICRVGPRTCNGCIQFHADQYAIYSRERYRVHFHADQYATYSRERYRVQFDTDQYAIYSRERYRVQ